ncbi:RNA polymerase sigma factor [Streptomyces sp. NBS 14/10]|uniref:RNA polymerase sigma factor n=1 Tax=Streptomyces sp. NBS 14/10 TaxID=1945643 RepID=UPI000B7EB92A|nr:RNA polymerase sigma factor [Streptomyces sp. NBS 14/10]KAK1179772.1 RNA polymerase sigma factor [Streptomyces sp. NBS 14/10]
MDSDEALVTRSKRRPAAFEPLVDRHSVALHAYLVRRCGRAAEDLLAEVWLAAFAQRAGYDPGLGSVRGWLFGIARNHVLAHWRREASRASAAAEYATVDGGDRGDGGAGWEAADARLDAAALLPAMLTALRELPEPERELLLLTAWEQLTPAEAARVAGIPAGTARSRLHRARARMRQLLGRGRPDGPGHGRTHPLPTDPSHPLADSTPVTSPGACA